MTDRNAVRAGCKNWKRFCMALALLILVFACILSVWAAGSAPVSQKNAENFGKLLTDLINAYEAPAAQDALKIEADLTQIRSVDEEDIAIAQAIASHWEKVYLDPDYELFVYQGSGLAPEIEKCDIPNDPAHAIVVLGYELLNGEMQPELKSRCEAAAAMARSYPDTVLVCSGGATGVNNPEQHTEGGLMKQYLEQVCGIDGARIFTDEQALTTAENAVNTFEILRSNSVQSMTIVTSAYHQRWGQALYNLMAEVYRQQHGFSVKILGNYCCDVEPSSPVFAMDDRIAAQQMAGILGLPKEVMRSLPSLRPAGTEKQ